MEYQNDGITFSATAGLPTMKLNVRSWCKTIWHSCLSATQRADVFGCRRTLLWHTVIQCAED
jgi:hypothetical protein